ncbi:glutathione S-transferase theta-3-like isoform X2 [Sceloporus undulatus]|uniref:glutathione S-transferase theta-3-like isoform X2 n=1 Tax=Sceloporus undulatus TaxID=8520 RepID=UPI001C4BCEA6|nr:glutathione S-transferase theta-3-like isoform X2 [Sceloporus undulatus]
MALELYLDLVSQPCRAVYIFAKKNNIAFDFKRVELMQGQHKAEKFLKEVNPAGKVPAMKDADFALSESIAILLYLARKFKTADHWYPSDLQTRARVDEYLAWQHTGVRMTASKVFLAKALIPVFLGHPLPPEKLEAAAKDLDETLALFEAKFLQDRPFIAGRQASLADLVAIVELMQPVAAGHNIFESRPKMAAWRSRVEDAVGKELFQEAHKALLSAKDLSADLLPPEMKEKLKETILKYIN